MAHFDLSRSRLQQFLTQYDNIICMTPVQEIGKTILHPGVIGDIALIIPVVHPSGFCTEFKDLGPDAIHHLFDRPFGQIFPVQQGLMNSRIAFSQIVEDLDEL